MESPKDYAIRMGLATPGRGRMSLAAHKAIQEAIASGVAITGYMAKPTAKTAKLVQNGSVRSVEPVKASKRYEETGLTVNAVRTVSESAKLTMDFGGKTVKVSDKAACGFCHYSLAYHICNTPTAVAPDGSGMLKVTIA